MSQIKELKTFCEKENIEMVDLKAVDLKGRLHHITFPVNELKDSLLVDGIGFDGSSYGFAKVQMSDMILIPDMETAVLDPFRKVNTLSIFANIHITDDKRSRYAQDPRYISKKAEESLKKHGIADEALFNFEFEFFLFNDISISTSPFDTHIKIEPGERMHHNAYHIANPDDIYCEFRDRTTQMLLSYGIPIRYHHHEVGGYGQQEIETSLHPMHSSAENAVWARYIMQNIARENNIVITFMPKPIYNHPGSGLHFHMMLRKNKKNIFYKKGAYANLSELALHFIGGILTHSSSLCAFTNPSTNSFKRLVAGFEAPVTKTFGRSNRSSAIRIPAYISEPDQVRFEYRPPDFTCNPYLALSAILMAGIDGIANRTDPSKQGFGPFDTNLYDAGMKDKIKFLPQHLDQALDELKRDNEYLSRNGVFPESFIEQYIKVLKKDCDEINNYPNPREFELYFS